MIALGTVRYFRSIASISDTGIYHLKYYNHEAIVAAFHLISTNQLQQVIRLKLWQLGGKCNQREHRPSSHSVLRACFSITATFSS